MLKNYLSQRNLNSVLLKNLAYGTKLFIVCLFLVVVSPALLFWMDYHNPNSFEISRLTLGKHFGKILISSIVVAYLFSIPVFFISKLPRKFYLLFLSLVLVLPVLLNFSHIVIFNTGFNASSWYSVFESSISEVSSFIKDYFSLKLVFSILLLFVGILLIVKFLKRVQNRIITVIVVLFSQILAVLCISIVVIKPDWNYSSNLITVVQLAKSYKEYKTAFIGLPNELLSVKLNINKQPVEPETHVVIIGESTSAYHMGLYNYNRNTTPLLTNQMDSLQVFGNVKSTHVHTVSSLKDVFYPTNGQARFSLIELLKSAGYHTVWISNQKFLGRNEDLSTGIAKQCNEQIFISKVGGNSFDEKLFKPFQSALNSTQKQKIIFVHLMGTHLSYQDRYPSSFHHYTEKGFSIFGEKADEFINNYDNAVRYNDFVISELLNALKKESGKKSLLYFSDHGDEVYDYRDFHGHNEGNKSKYMETVPFVIYNNFTDDFAKKHLQKSYYLSDLVHTLQDLYSIKSSLYKKEKSIYNVPFTTKGVKVENKAITNWDLESKDKIWIHRVNSLERFDEVKDYFTGFELDVVWENNCLNVRHPPMKSIGLSLEDYLTYTEKNRKNNYWFDVKNLTNENSTLVFEYIASLNKKFKLNKRVVIESESMNSLQMFSNAGYFTSCYLPGHENWSENKIDSVYNKVQITDDKCAVSQNIAILPAMNQFFPNRVKLVWALNTNWEINSNNKRIYNFLEQHPEIKVCLVNYSTPSWR